MCIVTPFGAALAADDAAPAPRRLEVDDFFKILGVDDPQISPDGRWVAYTVTTADLEADEEKTRIWMVPAGGGEPVAMTSEERSASLRVGALTAATSLSWPPPRTATTRCGRCSGKAVRR